MDDAIIGFLPAPELAARASPPAHILEPVLRPGTLALLHGAAGVGKSSVALGIAWAASSGAAFLGWHGARPSPVLYVAGELGIEELQRRMATLGAPLPTLQFLVVDAWRGPVLDLADDDSQQRLAQRWGDPALVVLDSVSSLAGLRDPDPDRWRALKRFLKGQQAAGRAVLLICHGGKKAMRDIGCPEDAFDLVLSMRRPEDWRPGDGDCFQLHFEKAKGLRADDVQPIDARLQAEPNGRWRWQWQQRLDLEFEEAVGLLRQGLDVETMADRLGRSRATGFRLQRRARRLGLLEGAPGPDR